MARAMGISKSSRLVMESVSAEYSAMAGYQRLSQSMRFSDEMVQMRKQQRGSGRTWRFLSRVFSGRKNVEVGEFEEQMTKEKESEKMKYKKRRSSWLPDPDTRWPVQGW